jgi:hypothetical protein
MGLQGITTVKGSDKVWTQLPLEEITGLPYASKMTSRSMY